ncbi:hypothetical protein J7E91_24745 [Streptomyces sp. ISL-99]|uniref:hypothetical protein n=1 Tax=Streptomyces sp. ISL-99 TaxID=2819193 RepID=UPI001BED0118|nr:hypothetical protein [Streptomyces sp. ISL-99]MBT2528530.1 hypothetical protein [Streptomyces sp. ISL-99]
MRSIRDGMPERTVVFHARAAFLLSGEPQATGLPAEWAVPAWDFETDAYTDRPAAWRTARSTAQDVVAQARGIDKEAVKVAFTEACAQAVDRAQNPGKYGDADDW